ncbi:hypothetical protein RvY_00372 [Ramazzottius varieornatus]|uniref:DDE-1 domain-containing protein n=1 Tax=Ramazzottius varieornatus TaxID=947166 RepID=A0A1D1UIV1_RAMVA|nr:hypothetical protein RvY_00372 [Ramazzottius varieornatus]
MANHPKLKTPSQVHKELSMEAPIHKAYVFKLQELRERGFLDRPEQVWNFDETAFNTSEMYDRVVARTGAKQIPSQFYGNEKENVTILPCGNAAGLQLKFMALHAGKVHVQSRLDDTYGLCYHAVNASGYMDQAHFANCFRCRRAL